MLAAHLCKEIDDTAKFLKKRRNYENNDDGAVNLRKSLAEAMASSVSNLQTLQSSDADLLTTALSDNPYGEFTDRVAVAVDNRLTFAASKKVKTSAKVDPQILTCAHTFFSEKDVSTFRNPKVNLHSKLSVGVSRLNRLGVTHPHEKTLRWAIAFILMCHYDDIPTRTSTHKAVKETKDIVNAERKPYPHHQIVNYPDSPTGLPPHMLSYAYDEGDPWVDVHVQGLENVAKNVMIMRGNHNALKDDDPPEPKHKKGGSQPSGGWSAEDMINLMDQRDAARARIQERPRGSGSPVFVKSEPTVKSEPRDDHGSDAAPGACSAHSLGGVSWGVAMPADRFGGKLTDDTAGVVPVKKEDGVGGDINDYADIAKAALDERDAMRRARKKKEAAAKKAEEAASAAKKRPAGKEGSSDEEESDGDDDDDDDGASQADSDVKSEAEESEPKKRARKDKDYKKSKKDKKDKDYKKSKKDKKDKEAMKGYKKDKASKEDKKSKKDKKDKKEQKTKKDKKVKKDKVKTVVKKEKGGSKARVKLPVPVALTRKDPMPEPTKGEEAPPTDYKGGRIYWKISSMAFRVIRKRKNYGSEKKIRWKKSKPSRGEWKKALDSIDEYKSKD